LQKLLFLNNLQAATPSWIRVPLAAEMQTIDNIQRLNEDTTNAWSTQGTYRPDGENLKMTL
jgi:hypothetical protein